MGFTMTLETKPEKQLLSAEDRSRTLDDFLNTHENGYAVAIVRRAFGMEPDKAGKRVEEASWHSHKGIVLTNNDMKCGRCASTTLVAGDCQYGYIDPICRETYGDGDLKSHRELFYVCLACAHVCHYPPEA